MFSPTAPSAAIRSAVVLDAGGLTTAQMQAIAFRVQLFRDHFSCCRRGMPAHDAQVRIFTVQPEIPFAGHPNVGTAFVLASARPGQAAGAAAVRGAAPGSWPVEILQEQGSAVGAELTAPQPLTAADAVERRAGRGRAFR